MNAEAVSQALFEREFFGTWKCFPSLFHRRNSDGDESADVFPRVADYVREKKWHESQQLRELKGGEVELSLKLSSLMEIQRWVLSWGGDVVVSKPKELIESVRLSAKNILKNCST